jgi:hypothetical protein
MAGAHPQIGGMRGRTTRLGPADVQDAVIEIDLVPRQVHQLGHEPLAEGQQDHGRVPIARRRLDQPLDLGLGQVLTGTVLGVPPAMRRVNCRNFAGWRDRLENADLP